MTTLAIDIEIPLITAVVLTELMLVVDLEDGRSISAPIVWFPRLANATQQEKENWRLIAKGHGIHWPDIDEDISAKSLILGRPSTESQKSFKKWMDARK